MALAGDNPQSARLPKAVSDAEQVKKFDATSPVGNLCLAKALLADALAAAQVPRGHRPGSSGMRPRAGSPGLLGWFRVGSSGLLGGFRGLKLGSKKLLWRC